MEFKMHNTQNDEQSAMSAIFEDVKKFDRDGEEEIDFESIIIERECFLTEIKQNQLRRFIGDKDDSTEIDSIINSLTSDCSMTQSPFKLCENMEETGTDEILEILKNPRKVVPVRGLSKSNPDFYNTKKISLRGRVLQNETSTISTSKRCVPERVSNPFMKNFGFEAQSSNGYSNYFNYHHN